MAWDFCEIFGNFETASLLKTGCDTPECERDYQCSKDDCGTPQPGHISHNWLNVKAVTCLMDRHYMIYEEI